MEYESEIERRLFDALIPMLLPNVGIHPQEVVSAKRGNYRFDMMLERDGRKSVIECDGREFHDYNADHDRDVDTLFSRCADEVLRLRGCDIFFDLEATILKVQSFLPHLFDSERRPHGVEEIELLSYTMEAGYVRPILRTAIPKEQVRGRNIGRAGIRVSFKSGLAILQLKSAYWDRTYRGPQIWRVDDYVNCFSNEHDPQVA